MVRTELGNLEKSWNFVTEILSACKLLNFILFLEPSKLNAIIQFHSSRYKQIADLAG